MKEQLVMFAVPDPLNLKSSVAEARECLANRRRIRQIVFDQQYVLRHQVLLASKPRQLYLAKLYRHRLCGIEHNISDALLIWSTQNPYVR